MYFKLFLSSLFVLFLVVVQFSFVSALPSYFSNINIILVFLVYFLMITSFSITINYAIAFGFLMDVLSFNVFGSFLFSFLLTITLVNFLLIHFFTNRSLYAFIALIISASILNFILVFAYNNIFLFFSGESHIILNESLFRSILSQIVLNSVLMLFVFYLTNFLSNSFQPVFLVNKKH